MCQLLPKGSGLSLSGGKATVVPGSDEVSTFRSEGVGRRSRCLVRVGRRFNVSAGRVRPQRRRGCRVGLRFNVSRRSRCGGADDRSILAPAVWQPAGTTADSTRSGSVWAPGGRRSTARPRIVLTCRSLSFAFAYGALG